MSGPAPSAMYFPPGTPRLPEADPQCVATFYLGEPIIDHSRRRYSPGFRPVPPDGVRLERVRFHVRRDGNIRYVRALYR